MSSYRLKNIIRKRRSDDESSNSDSDDDVPTVKRQRQCNGETNLKHLFTSKCNDILQWISRLPLKDYFKENMLRRSLLHQEAIDVINIDDEVVINTDDDDLEDIAVIDEEPEFSPSNNETKLESLAKNPYGISSKPLSSSTPFYRDRDSLHGRTSHSMPQKTVNGFHSKSWKPSDRLQRKPALLQPKSRYTQRISPITNPGLDVQVLLDSRDLGNKENDDLEIVSEVSKAKLPTPFPRETLSPIFKVGHTTKDHSVNFHEGMVNGKTFSQSTPGRERKSSVKAFTAHEVVRLQEKAQYKQLLERMVSRPTYQPVVRPKPAEIQIDLTEDDEPIIKSYYTKETLQKPMNDFLQKYYKPACLVTPVLPPCNSAETKQLDEAAVKRKGEDVQVVQIKKLPEYRSKTKKTFDFCDPSWINELKKTINEETESQLQKVAAQEQKIQRFQKRRDAKVADEMRLRDQYKLIGAVLPDSDVEKRDEFPDITPAMDAAMDNALEGRPLGTQFSSVDRLEITVNDVVTLAGLNWLNDQIINFYLALIVERSKLDNYPSAYTFNSFFYTSLKTRGENNVLRWTRRIDIFSYDLIFVPLHLGMHWALCVIDNRSKKIKYYDSMRSQEEQCLYSLQNYLVVEMKDKKKIVMDANTYAMETATNIPQQMNGSDCGMFTLKYAEYISRDAEITFTQANMQYFRRRMVYELLTKELL